MSSPPKLDHRGQKSYQDRTANYNAVQRMEQVKSNAAQTTASGLKAGPSGMPQRNYISTQSRGVAKDVATSAGHGHTPVHDTRHQPGQDPHFHTTTPTGERGNKNSPHVTYPQKNASMPSPKK